MYTWRLKKGSEKKFRAGHPWIFSSELAQSPKGLPAGALVEVFDYGGAFLARGYGHPNSMISFRTLTRTSSEPIDLAFFMSRLRDASAARRLAGVDTFSHRLCFAEADRIPGLIIDRYRVFSEPDDSEKQLAQVFVLQSSTAGIDLLLPTIVQSLEALVANEHSEQTNAEGVAGHAFRSKSPSWAQTAIIFANDSKTRLLENLSTVPKSVVKNVDGFEPAKTKILIEPSLPGLAPLCFETDLISGQKTGFFLDQRLNVHLAAGIANNVVAKCAADGRPLRVLDLCCYVGQWGTQLAHLARSQGVVAEISLVDASQKALEIASRNVSSHGGMPTSLKMDVLNDLDRLPTAYFDIVICDPPAFIKKKKDLPAGAAAYLKLNREALRRVARGGLFVSCTCSGLFSEDDFRAMLAKAVVKQANRVTWLLRGSHSADHPQRAEYPQGTYLKSWIGVIQ